MNADYQVHGLGLSTRQAIAEELAKVEKGAAVNAIRRIRDGMQLRKEFQAVESAFDTSPIHRT